MTWIVGTDGFPTNDLFPPMSAETMTKPYPKALWRIEEYTNDGFPFHELLPLIERGSPGAFYNAVNLEKVVIPQSVKSIGTEAFRNTALKNVQISSKCEYSETSFPDDCRVEFYDDYLGQLYDCNGKAVLDKYARRIYVRKEKDNG